MALSHISIGRRNKFPARVILIHVGPCESSKKFSRENLKGPKIVAQCRKDHIFIQWTEPYLYTLMRTIRYVNTLRENPKANPQPISCEQSIRIEPEKP